MELQKRVHAVNETTRLMKINFEYLLPQLKNFVGNKIFTQNGDKTLKFKKSLKWANEKPKPYKKYDYAQLHYIGFDVSRYSLWLEISLCFKDTDETCFYEKEKIYIGKMENGQYLECTVDQESIEQPGFKLYKTSEVKEGLKHIDELINELKELKSQFRPFI